MLNDKFRRITNCINLENKIFNWFKVGAQTFGSFSDYSGVSPGLYGITRIADPQTTPIEQQAALGVVSRDEVPFLEQMNAIVFQFDTESFERVKQPERIEWVLAVATLLTLLLEGLLVFRPVVAHTKNIIRRPARSETSLQQVNTRLEITNRELALTNKTVAHTKQRLRETRRELLRATEEKYQLKLIEETVRSAALLEGQEDERRRFARELHDGIGQMLKDVKLHAEKLKRVLYPDEKHRQRFAELCNLIADVIQTTRQVAYNLMPSTLSDFGLGPTLHLLAEQITLSSGTDVFFDGVLETARLAPAVEIGLYRITQDSLHNAVKYAEAGTIPIDLQQNINGLTLTVEDDGKGFTISNRKKTLDASQNGLANMYTRTRLLNGSFTIKSKPERGTAVRVHVPV